jgi:DNA polymerase III subunit delta'
MTAVREAPTSVWDRLVGQRRAIGALRSAAGGHGMSHSFLFTGPPGSGRSNAAIAFAAALQCEESPPGCGRCHSCHTVETGSHADVSVIRTEKLSIGVDEVRDLVRRAALAPVGRRWQVMIIEDADRLTDQAATALLKAIEEPTDRTVWMLCAPTVEDLLPTIRSRCRLVTLTTPSSAEVADFLTRIDGVDPALASYCARASQGHIGRARALASDEKTRNRRREVVSLPGGLTSLGACMNAAANVVDIAREETAAITERANARDLAELDALYGDDRKAHISRAYRAGLRDLQHSQKQREKRRVMDVVDRSLMDLLSVYRDALVLQTGGAGDLVNEEVRDTVADLARRTTPESNLRRIDAVFAAREQMQEFNTTPLLALESMMVALRV